MPKETAPKKPLWRQILSFLLASILLTLILYALFRIGVNVKLPVPAESEIAASGRSPGFRVPELLAAGKSDALDGLVRVPKVYRLPEDTLVAPMPDPAGYGSTKDPAEVAAVIAEAGELLGERTLAWNETTPFYEPDGIQYYRDDSILSVVWNEYCSGNRFVTYAEVVIKDASQLRRKLSGDKYGEGILLYPTEMAKNTNAVLAASGDFYRFRPCGVTVYQREVYRWDGEKVDTCFFDTAGNMNFVYAGEMTDKEQVERYVKEHDITFSLSFGPVLIDRGVNVTPKRYYLGEVYDTYPRCAIGQLGELHYLVVVVSRDAKIDYVGEIMERMGCEMAYTLDGGQSGTIVLGGERRNVHTIYQSQRSQSDIIYFATAIPEDGG